MSSLHSNSENFVEINTLTKELLHTRCPQRKLDILHLLQDYVLDSGAERYRQWTYYNLREAIIGRTRNEVKTSRMPLTSYSLLRKTKVRTRKVAKPSYLKFVLEYDNQELEMLEDTLKREKSCAN